MEDMKPYVHLLGRPRVLLHDATPAPVRGHKAWGLLGYLALHSDGVGRARLAGLLFEDAEDPLAALRWNLRELRRALGDATLRGDVITFPHQAVAGLDVSVLTRGQWSEALALPGLGGDFLEGMEYSTSPSFDAWLQSERRRMRATSEAVLREAAFAHLAARGHAHSVKIAFQLVALDPLNENSQVLLVRCLAASGDGVAASRQVAACRELFMRELGVAPSNALTDALHTMTAQLSARPAIGRVGALAQLEAGEAAIGAGALEAGLQCLRRAIVDADEAGDPVLRTRTRVALGGALVHAARGRDEEGAAALHEGLAMGRESAPAFAAAACRELGYVEFLSGQYERALAWMAQAELLANGDVAELARIATVQGSILSDRAYYSPALIRLRESVAWAVQCGDQKQLVYAEAMMGRTLLLVGDNARAIPVLDHAIEEARRMWTAFLPWPLSFRAEIDLISGHLDQAKERFDHAFALGCQLGDPCWEGIAGRGLGLIAMKRGNLADAEHIFLDTLSRCSRLPDAYLWGKAYVLESLCQLGVAQRLPQARKWVLELMEIASRAGMRQLVVQAHMHLATLGSAASAASAAALAGEIENLELSLQ